MNINIIGTVFIKGFETNKSEPIPIIKNDSNNKTKPIPIIKNINNENNEMKVSSSFMKIKTNKYSY